MFSTRTNLHPFNQDADTIMSTDYFFSGGQYIRVTRGDTGPGTMDPGYPAPISNWNWHGFGAGDIDAALHSGSKCYFFKGNQYIRVSRSESGVTPADLAPIVAVQLNFVDYLNGGSTTLSSGNGTITYVANQAITVSNSVPSEVDWDFSRRSVSSRRPVRLTGGRGADPARDDPAARREPP
jgi:hypothetical protein